MGEQKNYLGGKDKICLKKSSTKNSPGNKRSPKKCLGSAFGLDLGLGYVYFSEGIFPEGDLIINTFNTYG